MTDATECDVPRFRGPAVTPGEPRSGVGGVPRRPRRAVLQAADGVRIEAAYAPYAAAPGPGDTATEGARDADDAVAPARTRGHVIVLAHGFSGSVDRPALRRAARAFTQHAAVVTFSFRGHGGSGGRSTVGDREVLDLAAAVRWARSLGHRHVTTVGFSMGGSVVVRHGALHRDDPETGADAVVAVSAPARWYYRGTAPMRRLHWVVQRPLGRLVSRYGLRTRIQAYGWDPEPLSPVAAAPALAPTPFLVVHGDRDPYFPLDHPRSLAAAAGPDRAELWIVPGFGHAENAAEPDLLHRIGSWAGTHCPAVTPARHDGTRNRNG